MIKKFKFFNNVIENENIKITLIDDLVIYDGFLEGYNFRFDQYKYDEFSPQGKSLGSNGYIPFDPGDIIKLRKINNDLNDYIDSQDEIVGICKGKKYILEIEQTYHYVCKFLRKEYEDPNDVLGFVDPVVKEGVDLILNNKNLLSHYISINKFKENGGTILIESKDNSKYNMVVNIKQKFNNHYVVKLVSQIKGIYDPYKSLRHSKIKLHPKSIDPVYERIYIKGF